MTRDPGNASGTSRGTAERRKRGSQPGVARGPYKPRRIKPKEPQTPEESAALRERAREFWGDEMFNSGSRVFNPEKGRYVSVQTYVPADPAPEKDKYDTAESRVCRSCGFDWPLSYFSPSRTGASGVKGTCKTCCTEKARERVHTPEGKAARARTQAKYRAAVKADERRKKDRAAFIEAAGKTAAGRALLAAVGMTQKEDEKC